MMKRVHGGALLVPAALVLVLVMLSGCAIEVADGRAVVNAAVVDYDAGTGSVLLRSSGAVELEPVPHFNESGLVAELRAACVRAGVPFPAAYTLQTVSLLSFPQELPEYEVERAHWARHRARGRCAHWPLTGIDAPAAAEAGCARCNASACPVGRGAFAQPRNFSAADRAALAAGFGARCWGRHERLGARAAALHAWLTTPAADGRARVIAVHCHHGIDRTGELVAAYELRYRRATLPAALARAAALTGRGLKYCTQLAAQWECVRLRARAALPDDDCLRCDAPGTGASCVPPTLLWWCGSYNTPFHSMSN